ncbi:MAG: methyltransferase domain-containing protein [Acidimicrobiales bacterium]
MTWNATNYDNRFGFVSRGGDSLIDLLDPQPGERVLDLGCGTGELAAKIAARGASVVGLDADRNMIEQARGRFPEIEFVVGDGHDFSVGRFDCVFSNAALHWLTRPRAVTTSVRAALRTGGRFVAEQGGAGNVATTIAALNAARVDAGSPPVTPLPWYYPSVGEHATLLESCGFRVQMMIHFDRPSPLEDCPNGIVDWAQMFGGAYYGDLPKDRLPAFFAAAAQHGQPLVRDDGITVIDYVRLRWRAEAIGPVAAEPR